MDIQASGPQSVTVEDSMSMVHASRGKLPPASGFLLSEPAIVAGIAKATLPNTRVAWDELVADYDRIRDCIESVFPDFNDYNERIRQPGGFRLPLPATDRIWKTPSGKAEFLLPAKATSTAGALLLTTIRSHDQYNTTIYGNDDRYRGVFGRRDVVFMCEEDLVGRNLRHGDRVDITTALPGFENLQLKGFTAVSYDIAPGSVAAYFPEANCLVPLAYQDKLSGTPAYKSVPVKITRQSTTEQR
jgi:anaerobic selenocysteine-containing dehydrogenase